MNRDERSPERIRHHYEIETALADRLKRATREERRTLYGQAYDELYRQVPDVPHLDPSQAESVRAVEVARQLRFLARFLTPQSTFLEIGPGDCRLSIAAAAQVRQVYSVDVTSGVVDRIKLPANVTFAKSDGTSIPIPKGSVDVALSDQVIEHMHPEDADEHLRNVRDSLAPGGRYICITPNRLYGPHDVSKYFDDVARGLHLKEYSGTDLMAQFRVAGYSSVRAYTIAQARRLDAPADAAGARRGGRARSAAAQTAPRVRLFLTAVVILRTRMWECDEGCLHRAFAR